MTTRALVLGGGGVAGIAWEIGVLVGLAEAGIDVRTADLLLGTSAGSVVATQLASELSMEDLFQRQVNPALQATELSANIDMQKMMADFMRILKEAKNQTEMLQQIGAEALVTPTVTEAERRNVIISRLPIQLWPQRRLAIVAVDALSGERVVFERASAVDLIDAVAASCAVPLVWPPVTIGDRRYIDGGTYSPENADLAAGFDQVLLLVPDSPILSGESLETRLERLRSNGSLVEVIATNEAMKSALAAVGGNSLDPTLREASAHIGREQAQREAPRIAAFWHSNRELQQ